MIIRRLRRLLIATSIPLFLISTLVGPQIAYAQSNQYNCFSWNPWFGAPFNWRAYCGIFFGGSQAAGQSDYLWPGGLNWGGWWAPVESPDGFINAVNQGLNNPSLRTQTPAAFYILGMLGYYPPDMNWATYGRAWPEYGRWVDLVRSMSSYGQTGPYTWEGPSGYINFHEWLPPPPCGAMDSYYMRRNEDVALSQDLNQPSYWAVGVFCDRAYPWNPDGRPWWDAIVFHDWGGGRRYTIDRHCGNTRWDWNPPPPVIPLNYQIHPEVNPSSSYAGVGDDVSFNFVLRNSGSTNTPYWKIGCNAFFRTRPGIFGDVVDAGGTDGTGSGIGTSCPVWRLGAWGGAQAVASFSYRVQPGDLGNSVCGRLNAWPSSQGDWRPDGVRTERCIKIVAKPYTQPYGGDVSVGGRNQSASVPCTNVNAQIKTWNRGFSYGYAGSGTNYAAFAMGNITQYSTKPSPKGLSFSNTAGDSTYGGAFGKVDCIQDYYSRRLLANPATVIDPGSSVNNISSFQDGKTYIHNGDFTITSGGNTNPNQRTEVYVNGNVYIGGNITYNGSSWNMNKLPLLSIVATGNIYIGSGVSRLDGLYVAQGTGNRGIIYTCATGMGAPVDPRGGGWYSACNRKLTVNGAFVAQRVELLRTFGDLANAQATDTSDSNGNGTNSAEVFNYNPAMWMIGPLNGSGKTDNYDAITSLPPVL